jgi:hypothetical protein
MVRLLEDVPPHDGSVTLEVPQKSAVVPPRTVSVIKADEGIAAGERTYRSHTDCSRRGADTSIHWRRSYLIASQQGYYGRVFKTKQHCRENLERAFARRRPTARKRKILHYLRHTYPK